MQIFLCARIIDAANKILESYVQLCMLKQLIKGMQFLNNFKPNVILKGGNIDQLETF